MKKLFLSLLLLGVGRVWSDGTPTPVTPPLTALCTLSPASGSQAKGWIKFTQRTGYVEIEGDISGLTPGEHGFHVHEKGDCSAPDAASAGGHFNPGNKHHGAPLRHERHAGDLGNIKADANGYARFKFKDKVIQLSGKDSILDKAVILHADRDDMRSQPAGNAGKRIACGVIVRSP